MPDLQSKEKALTTLFRDEKRERISIARTVTERKTNRTLREKNPSGYTKDNRLCRRLSFGVRGKNHWERE